MRQLADEPDRVGQEVRPPVEAHRAGVRVQSVEQAVADTDLRAGHRVEERRLPGVRVARERDLRNRRGTPPRAHPLPPPLELLQAPAQRGDPVARQAAVGFDLRLARAAGGDAAPEPLEVRP